MTAGTPGSSNAVSAEEMAAAIVVLAEDPHPPARLQSPEWVAKLVGQKVKDLNGERVVGFTWKWLVKS